MAQQLESLRGLLTHPDPDVREQGFQLSESLRDAALIDALVRGAEVKGEDASHPCLDRVVLTTLLARAPLGPESAAFARSLRRLDLELSRLDDVVLARFPNAVTVDAGNVAEVRLAGTEHVRDLAIALTENAVVAIASRALEFLKLFGMLDASLTLDVPRLRALMLSHVTTALPPLPRTLATLDVRGVETLAGLEGSTVRHLRVSAKTLTLGETLPELPELRSLSWEGPLELRHLSRVPGLWRLALDGGSFDLGQLPALDELWSLMVPEGTPRRAVQSVVVFDAGVPVRIREPVPGMAAHADVELRRRLFGWVWNGEIDLPIEPLVRVGALDDPAEAELAREALWFLRATDAATAGRLAAKLVDDRHVGTIARQVCWTLEPSIDPKPVGARAEPAGDPPVRFRRCVSSVAELEWLEGRDVLEEVSVDWLGPEARVPALPKLQHLRVGTYAETTLQAVSHLYELRSLVVEDKAALRWFAGLGWLRNLRVLRAPYAGVAELPELELRATRLEVLHLPHSPLTHVSALEGSGVRSLDVSWTNVRDLSPLRQLSVLRIDGCAADFETLRSPSLVELSMAKSPARDFGFLQSLQKLERLDVSETRFEDIDLLFALPNLRAVALHDTPIEDHPRVSLLQKMLALRAGGIPKLEFSGFVPDGFVSGSF